MSYLVKPLAFSRSIPSLTVPTRKLAYTAACCGSSNYTPTFAVVNQRTGLPVAFWFNGSRFPSLAAAKAARTAHAAANRAGVRRAVRMGLIPA